MSEEKFKRDTKEMISSKALREILKKNWKVGARGDLEGDGFLEMKKKIEKTSSSFKSLMEVRSILIEVYRKLLQKSSK